MSMRWIGSILIGVFFYAAVGLYVGLSEVSSTIRAIGWSWWLYTIGVVALGHLLLLARWHLDLRLLGHPLPLADSARIYASGLSLIMAPARGGETLRGLWLKKLHAVPIQIGVGITLSERLLDLTSALLLAAWGLGGRVIPAVAVGCGASAAGAWLMTHPVAIRWRERQTREGMIPGHWERVHKVLREMLASLMTLRHLMKPVPLLAGISLSCFAWLLEAWILWRLFLAMNVDIAIAGVAAIRTISSIAGVLSFLPAGLGTSELSAIGMALLFGASRPQALAATLILRFSTVLMPFLVGSIVLLASPSLYRKGREKQD